MPSYENHKRKTLSQMCRDKGVHSRSLAVDANYSQFRPERGGHVSKRFAYILNPAGVFTAPKQKHTTAHTTSNPDEISLAADGTGTVRKYVHGEKKIYEEKLKIKARRKKIMPKTKTQDFSEVGPSQDLTNTSVRPPGKVIETHIIEPEVIETPEPVSILDTIPDTPLKHILIESVDEGLIAAFPIQDLIEYGEPKDGVDLDEWTDEGFELLAVLKFEPKVGYKNHYFNSDMGTAIEILDEVLDKKHKLNFMRRACRYGDILELFNQTMQSTNE